MLVYVEPIRPIGLPLDATVYLRRRLAVVLVLLALVLSVALLAPRVAGGDGHRDRPVGLAAGGTPPAAAAPAATAGHVVRPGDTVWSIAEALDPGGDLRATVDRIVEANGGATLVVGQRIELPAP
jgi:nucleoid-associated protein YgaU